jgi:hypothetical protein
MRSDDFTQCSPGAASQLKVAKAAVHALRQGDHRATTAPTSTPSAKFGVVVSGGVIKSPEITRLGRPDHYANFFSHVA